jgi:hypothetical protein
MKVEIYNLIALIQGRNLNLYQRSLAMQEWYKLLNHIDEMEQALSLGAVVGRSEQSCRNFLSDGTTTSASKCIFCGKEKWEH